MADFEMKVTGLRETQQALFSYSQQLGDKVVLSSLFTGAKLIAKQAKRNAPKATGRLRKAIFVKKSKIFVGKFNTGWIGVYIAVRRGKSRGDPNGAYYGYMVERGYNVRGTGRISRFDLRSIFNARSGRKTNQGKTDVSGKYYMRDALNTMAKPAIELTVASVHRGAEIVKRKVGLR